MRETTETGIPWTAKAINAREVGELLGVAPNTVLNKIACRPDFPRRVNMRPAAWIAGEVLEWRKRRQLKPIR